MSLRSFAANVVCAFIPTESLRHHVRVRIKFGMRQYIDFACHDSGLAAPRVRTFLGHCCKNLVVVLNDEIAYKFPLMPKKYHDAVKEKLFIDAFRKYSPVPLAKPAVLKYNGTDVLKYQFIPGKIITELSPRETAPHAEKIGRQLGEFIYAISRTNPRALAEYKTTPDAKPGFMYGWYHNDIGANFIVDPKTMNIVGFIDWAAANFCDFKHDFARAFRHLDHRGHGAIIIHAMLRYGELYNQNAK